MSKETRGRTYTPWWAFALAVLAGLGLIAAFVSSASSAPLLSDSAQTEVRGRSVPVQDGKLEYSVLDVDTGVPAVGDPYFGASPSSGAFTVVTLSITNRSDQIVTFDPSYVVGVQLSGDRLPSDREASYYADDRMPPPLHPGQEMTTKVAFDVPEGSRITGVQVHDSVFSRGAIITFKG